IPPADPRRQENNLTGADSAQEGAWPGTSGYYWGGGSLGFCFGVFLCDIEERYGPFVRHSSSTSGGKSMTRRFAVLGLLLCALFILVMLTGHNAPTGAPADEKKASPAEGYTVHVLAPHMVDGKRMGPYHHYCKVLTPDPVIECLIYESTEPGARLSQVEFIVAKKITRNQVSLK